MSPDPKMDVSRAPSERHREALPTILVVMGVSGAGKSTIGRQLAERLGRPFQEGDELHPPANIAKMNAKIPLSDSDRWPWLERIAEQIDRWRQQRCSAVITCSALARRYREFLSTKRPEVRFLYLKGEPALIAARLKNRKGHFMPPDLLDSQFAALEPPSPEEPVIEVESALPIETIVERLLRKLPSNQAPEKAK